jgi:hypothetical protein
VPEDAKTRVTLPEIPDAIHRASGVHDPVSGVRLVRGADGTFRCPRCDTLADLDGLEVGTSVTVECGCGFIRVVAETE